MLRLRKVADDTTPANRGAIAEAQTIMREQFPAMHEAEIEKLPGQLRDPLKHRFVSRLFVAEDARDRTLGTALLLYAPDLHFCYLELISVARGGVGRGIGSVLYERVREEAKALGAHGLYFECLPDDTDPSTAPEIKINNQQRLKFYERYGARPILGTAYETPVKPGQIDPPHLVLDRLGSDAMPSPAVLRKVVRAILERKYGLIVTPEYIETVVASIGDQPVRLREPRYARATAVKRGVAEAEKLGIAGESDKSGITMVVSNAHALHHVNERGYVEAPVRISSILSELQASGLFEQIEAKHYADRHIRAVHEDRLVDYIRRACLSVGSKKSIYPYVFPIRNAARPPKDRSVLAGYYCIDTFTPLNENAYLAARAAVDCTLTAADKVLEGGGLAYSLVRPPGHHAETRAFGGFCYFNNAAIAAHYLSHYGRIAILDIDYHHGNGQQDIFYQRADVLTVSIHGDPSFAYPYFTGFRDETGAGAGAGFNLNIPLPERIKPDDYFRALIRALARIKRFEPTYLVVAAGFDTARGDPTGTWSNGVKDFERIGRIIGERGYPTLVVQEGGYRVRTLGSNVRQFFDGLASGHAAKGGILPHRAPRSAEASKARNGLEWRYSVMPGDVERIKHLVANTGYFSRSEIVIAGELVMERLAKGASSGYSFLLAEQASGLAGYACYGPIDGTDGSFDLYWIAVHPNERGKGLGHKIFKRAEQAMRRAGAKRIYADTSSSEKYAPTRAFYERVGFAETARLPDFYREGDGKVVYEKGVSPT